MAMELKPTPEESERRDIVMDAILKDIRANQRILLPDFDPAMSAPAERFALTSVGMEPNAYGGTIGPYRYQFEGEEDLLHLIVTRQDSEPLTVEEGREVARFVVPKVPVALLWLKPGEFSQHFYLGHDVLIEQE